MKNKIILVVLCVCLVVVGSATAYYCFNNLGESPDYSSGMFVDRGESDGYATMYNLLTCL